MPESKKRLPVDFAIVAANECLLYLDFWPIVAYAYRTMFSGVEPVLVFLSERREDDPFVEGLREHGSVVLVRPRRDIPQAAQAKLARYHVAAQYPDAVSYIEDVDWIPIDADWYVRKVEQRRPGTLLLVGPEVYGGPDGQCPASMMAGEGRVFRHLFNPDGLAYDEWLPTLAGRAGKHMDVRSRAQHEGRACTTSQDELGTPLFSDEALVVALRKERGTPVTFASRDYEVGRDTIDRSCWSALDPTRLERGGYLGAHTGRPYHECRAGNDLILDYIRRRYGGSDLPEMLADARWARPALSPDMALAGEPGAAPGAVSRGLLDHVFRTIPRGSSILEFGTSHGSTNYLSRHYFLTSVTEHLGEVNAYPAYYVYAPKKGEWYDEERLKYGFACYPPYNGRYASTVVGPSALLGDGRGIGTNSDPSGPIIIDAGCPTGDDFAAVEPYGVRVLRGGGFSALEMR